MALVNRSGSLPWVPWTHPTQMPLAPGVTNEQRCSLLPARPVGGLPAVKMGAGTGQVRWGFLVVTFYGTSAHQVGEGKVQWPVRGEVGLGQGPHSLTHLQKQLSAWPAHRTSLGQLQAGRETMEGRPSPSLRPCVSLILLFCECLQSVQWAKLLLPRDNMTTPGFQVSEYM